MGKQENTAGKEAHVGKNHQLKVVSYDHGSHTALVELSPPFVDASCGEKGTRGYSLMSHVPKSVLAYLIGAKRGDMMDVSKGAVHVYRPDRMAEYVRACDKHKAEKGAAQSAGRNADAVAQLEALAADSDDSSAGEEIDPMILRELGESEGKK